MLLSEFIAEFYVFYTNSVSPDQTPHVIIATDLRLHCLLRLSINVVIYNQSSFKHFFSITLEFIVLVCLFHHVL